MREQIDKHQLHLVLRQLELKTGSGTILISQFQPNNLLYSAQLAQLDFELQPDWWHLGVDPPS